MGNKFKFWFLKFSGIFFSKYFQSMISWPQYIELFDAEGWLSMNIKLIYKSHHMPVHQCWKKSDITQKSCHEGRVGFLFVWVVCFYVVLRAIIQNKTVRIRIYMMLQYHQTSQSHIVWYSPNGSYAARLRVESRIPTEEGTPVDSP